MFPFNMDFVQQVAKHVASEGLHHIAETAAKGKEWVEANPEKTTAIVVGAACTVAPSVVAIGAASGALQSPDAGRSDARLVAGAALGIGAVGAAATQLKAALDNNKENDGK
ncbi:hypothetical protein F4808DRAFT_421525 [Astrocystis sublimbata]|nr:hypothetical protein F4808DRAFT_421525 [Astrocystis sublimbata]